MSIVPINAVQNRNNRNRSNSSWDPNSLSLWDPFIDFHFPLLSPIPNFFPQFASGSSSSLNTRLDWRHTPTAHVWRIVLPGFANEDVFVELQDERMLQVSVESGDFMTRFKIPHDGNLQHLKADIVNGVLVVTVPKVQQISASSGRNIRVVEIEGTD
ncbi:18.1 kDa class I heat shock protein-like [Cicer arietinum]|uniref:18.1 kDa class I heat shock protein-like n=1 Tax=Cicer arietinum TaxID=3827 RepID=A0A1S2YMU8_CICAR|nr:18.1 kDa class I heat shock protein-like [Cicer arietinum]